MRAHIQTEYWPNGSVTCKMDRQTDNTCTHTTKPMAETISHVAQLTLFFLLLTFINYNIQSVEPSGFFNLQSLSAYSSNWQHSQIIHCGKYWTDKYGKNDCDLIFYHIAQPVCTITPSCRVHRWKKKINTCFRPILSLLNFSLWTNRAKLDGKSSTCLHWYLK